METTIERSRRFTNFLETQHRYADAIIDPVFDKLFNRERQTLLEQRSELRASLNKFERQYALESSEFYDKFESGEIGDDMDFFEWYGTWRMYQNTLKSLRTLDPEMIEA